MVTGLLVEGANSQADILVAAFPWVQLHAGAEVVSGAPASAGNTTRKDVSAAFAPSVNGVAVSDVAISWSDAEVNTSEQYAYASFWSASSGGTCGFTASLTAVTVQATVDTFSIPAGSLTVAPGTVGLTSVQLETFQKAVHVIVPNSGQPYDTIGGSVIDRGATQDGASITPFTDGGLAAACSSANVATTRPFIMTPTLDHPTTNILDLRMIFYADEYGVANSDLFSKWDTSGDQRCWNVYISMGSKNIFMAWSSDGTVTNIALESFTGLTLVDGTTYAIRCLLDVAGGTCDWEQHDIAYVLNDDWSRAPLLSGTDTHTTLSLNADNTVPIAVGCSFVADPEVAASSEFPGLIRFAQVRDGDGGTIMATFDPTRDTTLDAVSSTDSDTTDTWALASAITAQTDWPTSVVGKALDLPGASGDFAHTPDSASASVTGDIDIRVHAAADDWVPATPQALEAKWTGSGNQRSYLLRLENNGTLRFYWSNDGATTISLPSTAATGFTNGEAGHVRVTLDVDNGASGNDLKFYTSTDGVTWTQLGTTVTTAGTTSIYDSTSLLTVGADADTGIYERFTGEIYSAQVYDGIDGTLVADFRPSHDAAISDSTFTSSTTGEVWTVAGSAAIVASPLMDALLRSPLYFDGGDFLQTSYTPTVQKSDDFTVVVVVGEFEPSGAGMVFSSTSANDNGVYLYDSLTQWIFILGDGTNRAIDTAALTQSTGRQLVAGVVTGSTAQAYADGAFSGSPASTTSVGTVTHAGGTVGKNGHDTANRFTGDIEAVLIFEDALTATELAALATYYGV